MDAYTLAVTTCLAAALMAASLYALYRASPDQRSLRDWSFAGLFFSGSSALELFSHSVALPYWLAPALSNSLLVGAQAAMLLGLRRHLGRVPGWRFLLAGMLAVALLHGLPWLRVGVESRVQMLWPLLMAINLATAWQMVRSPGFGLRSELLPLFVLVLANATQMGLRLALLLSGKAGGLTLLGSEFLQTSGQLALFLFILLSAMSCAFLVIRGQALQLQALAESDPMTGWRNRRSLARALGAARARSQRLGQPFALLLFDIDHFKTINDRHGHAVGDQAICHVTRMVAEELRDYDERYRIGGEEFLILLPPESAPHARAVAERLRLRVQQSPLEQPPLAITVSVGYALLRLDRDGVEDGEALLRRADEALYAAKRGGRNRSMAHEDGIEPEPVPA